MKAKRVEIPMTLKSHPGKCIKLSEYYEKWGHTMQTCELSNNLEDALKIFIDSEGFVH